MAWRDRRVNVLNVLDIPDGIPEGAVIGRGGCESKRIAATHRVRCRVQRGTRQVFVEGSREGVDNATRDIQALLDHARAERERDRACSHDEWGQPVVTTTTIHTIALASHTLRSTWRFENRDGDSVSCDASVKDFPYRMVEIPGASHDGIDDPQDQVDNGSRCWVSVFDANFRQRMVGQVASISAEDVSSIKLKVAFGLQYFALPDTTVSGGKIYSLEELRALELHKHIKPRWSNMLNGESVVLMSLLDELEAQFGASTTFKTELVVYVNKRQGSKGDISIKFRWEYDEWVLVERKPVRVARALYNIALDNETAFRVRVYSREDAPPSLDYSEIVEGLKITTASERDPFSTTVTTQQGFPNGLFLRSFAVRETATVEAHGLRFTISYMDTKRKTATIACRLPENDTTSPSEAVESLVAKVLAVVNRP